MKETNHQEQRHASIVLEQSCAERKRENRKFLVCTKGQGKRCFLRHTRVRFLPAGIGSECGAQGYVRDESDCSVFYYCAGYIRYVQPRGGTYS